MRIQQVRFKNLNSLVGEWEIDFSHPAFASDGIFAITGPTGAGKTTILDAVCLALYGRTPRLNKVTKSENEIMSRQTGECFAEIIFETPSGRYRCHWSQHRARKKSDGELQSTKHEITNADSGEIIESSIKGVSEQVELATGMDFDRFTRSMLLAQGGFAAFLHAAPDERAPILEQITGTEIYSQISIRVHEQLRKEKEKLNLLQAETSGIPIFSEEQEKEILQVLETKQEEETNLASKFTAIGKSISWLTNIEGLEKEIGSLADEYNKLQIDIEAFKPNREKLNQALNAASLDGVYATLIATRKQQADDSIALKKEKEKLPGLESSVKEHIKAMELAELQTKQVKTTLKEAAPVLQKIRSLDQKIKDHEKAILEIEKGCERDEAKINADKKTRIEEQEKRTNALATIDIVDAYLKKHKEDEWLIGNLAGIEEQLNGLISKQNEIHQNETKYNKATMALELAIKSLEKYQEQSHIRKQEFEDSLKQIKEGKEALNRLLGDRLLREYRTEKETLLREMAFLTKIAELKDYRAKLEDGKSCPLCGAIEHPFAEGNVPVPDETEQKIDALTRLIDKAEEQEVAIKKFEEAENLVRLNLTDAEKLELAAANDKKSAENALAELNESLMKLRIDFAECRHAVLAKLQQFGIADIPDKDISSLNENLRVRLKVWQDQNKKKADIEKQVADIDSEVKKLDAVIETQSTVLSEKLERLDVLRKEHVALNNERNALYGDKNPNDEEHHLNKAISDAEGIEDQAREINNELQQKLTTMKTHVESLKKRIDQREPELRRLETEFSAALAPVGFSNEEQFLAAQLPTEEKSKLTATTKYLDELKTDLRARQKDREERLTTEMARKITDKSLEELEPQFREHEEALKELRGIIAGLKHKLSENTATKERIKEKQVAINAQKKECGRWGNLHELIGSADGKKYRNFVQGLTFQVMVNHANKQLQKMTDRYLLIRDNEQPLELNVIDNYQAGEIRTTKNLSGGEGFIVSLSLALGLSKMSSQNVRVDSLFLDEGFGALDEEALETALETLANLQQDGKLIGVISHVNALKERISTQIQVIPQTGGKSILTGPGYRRDY